MGDMAKKLGEGGKPTGFVANIRGVVESEAPTEGTVEDKLRVLEGVLTKVVELDRAVLSLTEPQKDSSCSDKKPARRASRGMDLFTIPTHMHVIDRLVDLHTQSRRVTVIHKSDSGDKAPGPSPAPPAGAAAAKAPVPPLVPPGAMAVGGMPSTKSPRPNPKMEAAVKSLKEENRALKKQLEEAATAAAKAAKKAQETTAALETQSQDREAQIVQGRLQIALRDEKLDALRSHLEEKERALAAAAAECEATFGLTSPRGDMEDLRDDVQRAEEARRLAEERLEVSDAAHAAAARELMSLSQRVRQGNVHMGETSRKGEEGQEDGDEGGGVSAQGERESALQPETANALAILRGAIHDSLGGMQTEVTQLHSAKDELENSLSSYKLERELMDKDLQALQSDHDAVKGAYTALEHEVREGRKLAQNRSDGAKELKERAEDAERRLGEANVELALEKRRSQGVDELAGRIAELEVSLSTSLREMKGLHTQLEGAKQEKKTLSKLVETLKTRIRDMSGKDSSQREFLDSFEEVMREEMMAMKSAFETKLKLARDEADALSQTHREEMHRMRESNSRTRL